ncbi:MAG TPA: hypothetical protein VES42_14105 [Pilimelia sp.]|nr:hypothetical protein [Pilimelia sp.]
MSLSNTSPQHAHVIPGVLRRATGALGRALTRNGAEAAGRPPLAAGERILRTGLDDGGRAVVGTNHALYHQRTDVWLRWGWELVHRVDWDADRRTLTLWAVGRDVPGRTALRLPAGDRLAWFACERVSAQTVIDTHVRPGDGRLVRVIARRRPGSDELLWIVTRPGAHPGAAVDAEQDDHVTAAITRIRRELGV